MLSCACTNRKLLTGDFLEEQNANLVVTTEVIQHSHPRRRRHPCDIQRVNGVSATHSGSN